MVSARKAVLLVWLIRGAQARRVGRRPGSKAIRVVLVDRTGRRVAGRLGEASRKRADPGRPRRKALWADEACSL
jgi:hypothetical protein